jgi:hypothetical protein
MLLNVAMIRKLASRIAVPILPNLAVPRASAPLPVKGTAAM